jgi:Plavaka transposase
MDDWTPFSSRIEFELAELLFKRAEASNSCIDDLLDLWAADVLCSGRQPPFADHDDLHDMIDSIEEGRTSWHSFQVSYQGERPTGNVPSWMDESYDVWHRDPHKVIEDLLANSDFDGSFDYVPYQEFENGKRRWSDFMSGNWAWKQAVCTLFFHTFTTYFRV